LGCYASWLFANRSGLAAPGFTNLFDTKGLGAAPRPEIHNPLVSKSLQPKKTLKKPCLVVDKSTQMVSNIHMKNREEIKVSQAIKKLEALLARTGISEGFRKLLTINIKKLSAA